MTNTNTLLPMIFSDSERVEVVKRNHPYGGWLWIEQEVLYKTKYCNVGVMGSRHDHGKYIEFYKDGKPYIFGTYNMDNRVGLWYMLGKSSEIICKVFMDNDSAEGEAIEFSNVIQDTTEEEYIKYEY